MQALRDFFKGLEILTPEWAELLKTPAQDRVYNRKLLRYFIGRYWLQAVSDFDLVGRVKMVIAACLLVRHLGGDLEQTAQLYAKEIENNADNVDAILEGAYSSPALTDEKLIGMLLEV